MRLPSQLAIVTLLVAIVFFLAACATRTPGATDPTVSAEAKVLKANEVLATAAASLVDPVTELGTAGVLTPAQVSELLGYAKQTATVSQQISALSAQPGTWQSKLPQIVALTASIAPPATIQKYTGMNQIQYQALVTAVQGLVSAAEIIAIEVQP